MKHPYVTFWPGTPGGHIPFLADEVLKQKRGAVDLSAAAAKSRQTQLAKGITGTIRNLSRKSKSIKGDGAKGIVGKKAVPA